MNFETFCTTACLSEKEIESFKRYMETKHYTIDAEQSIEKWLNLFNQFFDESCIL